MSRNQILAVGALLWTVVMVDALAHVATGDLVAPALMAICAIVGVSLIAVRSRRTLSEDN